MRRLSTLPVVLLASCLLVSVCLLQAAEINPGDVLLTVLEKDYPPQTPLLPEGAKVVAGYRELSATPAGIVDFVENEAYVLHADDKTQAYKAEKSKPVYPGDILVSGPNSRVVVLMNDQSQLSLAALSKLTLEKTAYDAAEGSRGTVVGLAAGKARFVVQKLGKGQDNDFQVQTPLAVIGVRGSDFVVAMVPESDLPKLQQKKRTGLLDLLSPGSAFAQSVQGQGPPSSTSPQVTMTLTGTNTTVGVTSLQGPAGPVVIMNPSQVTVASSISVSMPLTVSPTMVPTLLNRVGPTASVMGMPSAFE